MGCKSKSIIFGEMVEIIVTGTDHIMLIVDFQYFI